MADVFFGPLRDIAAFLLLLQVLYLPLSSAEVNTLFPVPPFDFNVNVFARDGPLPPSYSCTKQILRLIRFRVNIFLNNLSGTC